jgi:hypothetical protein
LIRGKGKGEGGKGGHRIILEGNLGIILGRNLGGNLGTILGIILGRNLGRY